ncbi:hypothetical protein OHC33_008404 [Knufia fluminis]|uniref:Uncharacterized protein n=1 Tax=Knufia fluminis TaxID=191047 RepID=A0AAN8EN40_9EURO|nr:hypothetical protein OHC33_008404 [Knufia fluminis]
MDQAQGAARPNVATRATRNNRALADGRAAGDIGPLLEGLTNEPRRTKRVTKKNSTAATIGTSRVSKSEKKKPVRSARSKATSKTPKSQTESGNPVPDGQSSDRQHEPTGSQGTPGEGAVSGRKAAEPSLTGIPTELRDKIFRELLQGDDLLLDIPLAIAKDNDVNTTISLPPEHAADLPDDDDDWTGPWQQWKSHLRYKLHPQILSTCRFLNQEGTPLLYEGKTIGVTFLEMYPNVAHPPTRLLSKTYCAGVVSKGAGLRRTFKRYPLYAGSATGNIGFTLDQLHCDNFAIVGSVPQPYKDLITKYATLKQTKSLEDVWAAATSIYKKYQRSFRICRACRAIAFPQTKPETLDHWQRVGRHKIMKEDDQSVYVDIQSGNIVHFDIDGFYRNGKQYVKELVEGAEGSVACEHVIEFGPVPDFAKHNREVLARLKADVNRWLDECP